MRYLLDIGHLLLNGLNQRILLALWIHVLLVTHLQNVLNLLVVPPHAAKILDSNVALPQIFSKVQEDLLFVDRAG